MTHIQNPHFVDTHVIQSSKETTVLKIYILNSNINIYILRNQQLRELQVNFFFSSLFHLNISIYPKKYLKYLCFFGTNTLEISYHTLFSFGENIITF